MQSALGESFSKLNPMQMMKNPVMFTVEIGTAIMVVVTILSIFTFNDSLGSAGYNFVITLILLLTLLFANFAEAIAEARGKAQANALKMTRTNTMAKREMVDGTVKKIGRAHV